MKSFSKQNMTANNYFAKNDQLIFNRRNKRGTMFLPKIGFFFFLSYKNQRELHTNETHLWVKYKHTGK